MKIQPSPETELFEEFEIRIDLVKNIHSLNFDERERFWTLAVEAFHRALKQGQKSGEAKRMIAAWLWRRLPALAKSESAMLRQLYLKIERWNDGCHLRDARRDAGQQRRAPGLSKEDRDALVKCAVYDCGGQIDFAWRSCYEKKWISRELRDRHPAPAGRLHRCPKKLFAAIKAEVALLIEHNFRPHWLSNNIGPRTRAWNNVFAQDWFESDDLTLDVYCRVPGNDGKETDIRCQFLPMVDRKSGAILDFVLIGERNYNSVSIRALIKKVCLKYGLPNLGFVFERGIWKSAKLLGNNAKNRPFAEVENFATRCGVQIRHALPGRARTKIVETVIRLFGKKLVGLPGYVGNDEMHRKRERLEVSELLTFDDLFNELENLVDDYNGTLSNSIVKGGLFTPKQVWESKRRLLDTGELYPISFVPPEFQFLLGDIRRCRLRIDGVKFKVGSELFHYHSDKLVNFYTGLVGHDVQISWFPDSPGTAVVHDMKEKHYFDVQRVPCAPAAAENKWEWEQVAAAGRPYQTAMRQIRQRFSDIKMKPIPAKRIFVADAEARNKAEAINAAHKRGEKQQQQNRAAAEIFEEKELAEMIRENEQFKNEHPEFCR